MTPAGPPPVPGGRNPEDREAARREREARRTGRGSTDGASDGGPNWRERAERLTSARAERPSREQRAPRRLGISRGERAERQKRAPRRQRPPRPKRAPRADRPAASGSRRRRLVAALGAGALVMGLIAAWFLVSLFQPLSGDGKGEGRVSVRVPAGAGVGAIAEVLERRGVIGSSFFFQTRARISGRSGDLKPGVYRLGEGMSIKASLDALAKGPAPNVLNVTVPEGRPRREVARALPRQLRGNYLAVTRRSDRLSPARYGAPRGASLEGFLFPSTYELKKGKPVSALVAAQLGAFKSQFAKVDLGFAKRARLTSYEVLTIASMVEREAQLPRERPLVASVIFNRLREGIPLGIDATIRYATNNWDRPLTRSQLQVQSPFNTRTNKGLPPGPIGSPGLDSIRAAAKPARSGFLFYVVKPGTCGEHDFSRTNAEFEADVARYNRERERLGGRSPTKC